MTTDNILLLLNAPEALDAYLVDVRHRLEANRGQRRRAYWLEAVERLGKELEAARPEQDEEIIAELEAVIGSFTDALAAAGPSASAPPSSAAVNAELLALDLPASEPSGDELPPSAQGAAAAPEEAHRNGTNGTSGTQTTVSIADEAAQHLLEETARQALVAKAADLEDRLAAYLEAGGGSLPAVLRARSLFCEGQALIHDPHAPKQGRQPLLGLLDDLAAGSPWEGVPPFGSVMLSPQAWRPLAELYDACVVAGEAMSWYEENEEHLSEQARIDLLNAISAAQQRLYRRPESVVRHDDPVQELYQRVRTAGSRTAFIRALSAHASDAELPALAGRCFPLLRDLRAEVEEARRQAERAARKEAAVAAVVAWEVSLEGRGVAAESLEPDRQALCALLDECLAAGVHTSNIKVRAAILGTAPVLLEGQSKYAKFLEAVTLEREKRSLAAVEVAPPEIEVRDEELGRLVEVVASFACGKKIVMLGGKCRPQVAQELCGLLKCEMTWLDSDRGDKFTKFASSVKKADAVLMLKNFASHELFYGSKGAMEGDGKHFVVIPSGYSVKQVVYQLSEYVARARVATT